MSRRLAWPAVVAAALLTSAGWPAASPANHITGITASVGARLAERSAANAWIVEVGWNATCEGAIGDPVWGGTLNLIDERTGATTFLGGINNGAGVQRQLVHAKRRWQRLRPELTIHCFEGALDGAGPFTITGASALVPPRFDPRGGGGGGRGGGRGGGATDPTAPVGAGGCVRVLLGTAQPDQLIGTGAGEVVFGLGAADRIRAGGGHDCVLGGSGDDRLEGGDGSDRLTGSEGDDVLIGGRGRNLYEAGRGKDLVDAANGRRELVRCGSGRDRARVDRTDRIRSCERVRRVRRR